jgi:hypothetical protein
MTFPVPFFSPPSIPETLALEPLFGTALVLVGT